MSGHKSRLRTSRETSNRPRPKFRSRTSWRQVQLCSSPSQRAPRRSGATHIGAGRSSRKPLSPDPLHRQGGNGRSLRGEGPGASWGSTVAIKTMLPAIAANPEMIAQFKREIQLSRRVTHPNVCRIFDLVYDQRPSAPSRFSPWNCWMASHCRRSSGRRERCPRSRWCRWQGRWRKGCTPRTR